MQSMRIIAASGALIVLSHSASNAADPPVIVDLHICCVLPGVIVDQTLFVNQGDFPITWSNFTFDSFIPLYGDPPGGPFNAATFDPETQVFSWDTTGSPHGLYEWRVMATNQFGSDQGSLIVDMTFLPDVPEPNALSLVAFAMIGLFGLVRHRI